MEAQATSAGASDALAANRAANWSRSLRALHAAMVEAAIGEDGLGVVAELAADSLDAPVAIVAPRLGGPWLAPAGRLSAGELARLVDAVMSRVADRRMPAPALVRKEAPIVIGDEVAGVVALLCSTRTAASGDGAVLVGAEVDGPLMTDGVVGVDDATVAPHATKVIHLAAMAALTGALVVEAREQTERRLHESLLQPLSRDGSPARRRAGGTYRLLSRVLASYPEEVQLLYESTVAPLVGYDERYGSDLLATLRAYLANNCNMNATAGALLAHRHTIAYRLERIRGLTGLDPSGSEDRERLGLGLKAYEMIDAQLPR
ncbi:MAG TPA: helix-turn-helix domain-containing protein [Solirubrobacteraceae bacterium]|nr:helix-turn-helix domain-containing protein [Solirubrobacteraceae bacterium]